MKDYRVSFALTALMAMGPAVAMAQTTPASTSTAQSGEVASEVVVTGSRISRKDYSAETPIVTLGAATVEKTGSPTLDTALKEAPQFTASTGSSTNSSGNGGQANIQLRGLGRQRTLVLMDGRRLPSSNSDGSVDINTLPTALIDNIEIITGGASAVYGSDAVAGVVNIRMKHRFDGLEVDAQTGVSGHGDANTYKLSVFGGGDFAQERGSNVFSIEYSERDSITLADRDFTVGANRDSVLPTGIVSFATGAPSQAAIDAVFAKYGVAAGTVKATNSFSLNADGTLFTTGQTVQNYRGSTDAAQFHITPSVVQAEGRQFRYLQLPLQTYSIFDRASYEISNDLHAFGQFYYTHEVASTRLNAIPLSSSATLGYSPIPVTNPFIPADLKTLLASRTNPNAPITFGSRFDDIGARVQQNTTDVFQIVGGLDGKLPVKDWTWSVDGSYANNDIGILYPNQVSRAALTTLVTASDGGASICSGGFNPFITNPSAACQAYITKRVHSSQQLEQRVFEANSQGGLFKLPAGDVRYAAGVDYREERYTSDPDSLIQIGDIPATGGSYFTGRTTVKELYGELLVPIIKDIPLVHALDADIGFRASDYNTVGTVTTYKADLSWKTVYDLTFRGGYERAIRAPNVGELDTPVSSGNSIIGLAGALGSGDPCDVNGAYRKGASAAQVRALCIANGVPASVVDTYTFAMQSAQSLTGGNSKLQEETADTFSVGAVWRPRFKPELFRNISVSVDYYDIDVKNAIGTITPILALSRCFNATGSTNPTYDPNNVFCKLITRNSDGSLNQISAQSLNLGGYKTSGIDIQMDWRFATKAIGLNDGGQISLNLITSYLNSFQIKSLPGDPFLEYAGTIGNGQIDPIAISRPHWKSNLYLTYDNGPVTAGATWRFIGNMDNAANVGVANGTAAGVPSVSYFDLNLHYRLTPKLELWGTVVNLTDKQPPVYPAVGSTDAATYDVVGRAFTVGIKARF